MGHAGSLAFPKKKMLEAYESKTNGSFSMKIGGAEAWQLPGTLTCDPKGLQASESSTAFLCSPFWGGGGRTVGSEFA